MALKLHIANDLFDLLYPVGSYYETSNTDWTPQGAGWYGTWVEDTAGRVTVAISSGDTEFDTIGKTGGSKVLQAHTHKVGTWQTSNEASGYGLTKTSGFQNRPMVTASLANGITSGEAGTGTSGNLQPYIVVKRWHRTA